MTTRSPSFIYTYANTFAILIANDIVTMKLGIAEDPTNPTDILEQTGIIMNLASAKQFSVSLQGLLEKIEAETGHMLLPESRIEEIKASLRVGPAQESPNPSPTV